MPPAKNVLSLSKGRKACPEQSEGTPSSDLLSFRPTGEIFLRFLGSLGMSGMARHLAASHDPFDQGYIFSPSI